MLAGAGLPAAAMGRQRGSYSYIEFIVPHCDPTVNLYERLYCLRGGAVEDVWPIAARGMSQ